MTVTIGLIMTGVWNTGDKTGYLTGLGEPYTRTGSGSVETQVISLESGSYTVGWSGDPYDEAYITAMWTIIYLDTEEPIGQLH